MPDDQIDISDIPEVTGRRNWIKNTFYRPVNTEAVQSKSK